ncbi:hypothetical protein [Roseivirga sp. E12]|uniref:hypothetical protein n=1 Tax=Roseivirga sp. E12 TaxID=2819237 RepID=UPI001ABC8A2F|nr:hypothetical protein [Roseivirga sp. E12]MBO3699533.1 hypothetical protein [Roseivirga sp. E12]
MKKILLSIVLILGVASLSAQELSTKDVQAIDQRTGNFLDLIKTKKYTQVLDYIYPELFEHTSKKSMFQIFDLLEKAGIELKFNSFDVVSKKPIAAEGDIKYAMIKYKMDMTLPLDTDDLKGIAALLVPSIQSSFGKENVEYNRAESYINVKGEKFLLGVSDPKYGEWMFIIYDDSFKSAIDKTLPPKVKAAAAASAY